jgi:glycosyltransferase involved in cell wall biosynthesis
MFEFLDEPIPITSQQWREGTIPLVSISCITYNHENFIRDAIEGFLMQKTTFPVEILIHDDASTDKTAEIVREYEKKYPQLIKPIYQTENQYSKNDGSIGRIQRERAVGKYYATCEGDDYWTDPLKLQKQVDFLERNPDYVLTCHRYSKFDFENNEWISDDQDKFFLNNKEGFSFVYPFKSWITKTLTLVYRRSALSNMSHYKGKTRDTVLVYFLMKSGKGYCFNDNMGVYRLHNGGVVSKQVISKKINDGYLVLKDLYYSEKNNLTRSMYYSKYFSIFVTTKGGILFKEKFELLKFLSLLYFLPIKTFRFIKRKRI